eukprot:jgi/Chlat1/4790/Chrsp31S04778
MAAAAAAAAEAERVEEVDWVEMLEEPHHRLAMENDYARVVEAGISGQGACMLFHRHAADTFFVALSEADLLDEEAVLVGGEGRRAASISASDMRIWRGKFACLPYASRPIIHRVTCPAPHTARFLCAEVVTAPPVASVKPLECRGYTLAADTPEAGMRVYRLVLGPGESTGAHEYHFSGLIVCLTPDIHLAVSDDAHTNSPFQVPDLKQRGWHWHNGPVSHVLLNPASSPAAFEALVVEWLGEFRQRRDCGGDADAQVLDISKAWNS